MVLFLASIFYVCVCVSLDSFSVSVTIFLSVFLILLSGSIPGYFFSTVKPYH